MLTEEQEIEIFKIRFNTSQTLKKLRKAAKLFRELNKELRLGLSNPNVGCDHLEALVKRDGDVKSRRIKDA